MNKSVIYSEETSPTVLSTYAMQAVLNLWPEAKNEADQMLIEFDHSYGEALRSLVVFQAQNGQRKSLPPIPVIKEWWGEHNPFDEQSNNIYKPWVNRWLLGSEPAELAVFMTLILDLLNPLLPGSQRERDKLHRKAGPLMWKSLALATNTRAETWSDAYFGRYQARRALRERGQPFYGWQARALVKGAEFWALVRIPSPGANHGVSLADSVGIYQERHPKEIKLPAEYHVSDMIAPFDEALGVTRTRGAPPGRPRNVISR